MGLTELSAAVLGWLAQAARPPGRPLVTISYAQALDGSIGAAGGGPLALSGAASLRLTHALRAAHAGILVGIGTVLADDPQLTVRLAPGEHPQPVVLDSRLRIPLSARLLSGPRRPWLAALAPLDAARRAALEGSGARLLPCEPDAEGRIPLPELLGCLSALGLDSLMVEGGSRVIQAFIRQGLADLGVITIAPRFAGGLNVFSGWDDVQSGMPALALDGAAQAGEDLVAWGKFVRRD
jgi:riboflavin-specific deaminase-like protein